MNLENVNISVIIRDDKLPLPTPRWHDSAKCEFDKRRRGGKSCDMCVCVCA